MPASPCTSSTRGSTPAASSTRRAPSSQPDDNISTYQHRQIAVALPLLIRAIEDALAGRLEPHQVDLPSRQWFHPTLWAYFKTGLKQGVW